MTCKPYGIHRHTCDCRKALFSAIKTLLIQADNVRSVDPMQYVDLTDKAIDLARKDSPNA